jgi:hypothetical protein
MRWVFTPPTEWRGVHATFLAGGITGCPDWQSDLIEILSGTPRILLNPRRPDFPIHDPSASEKQIAWEHRHLRRADHIIFWFCAATLCPIVLYELGAWSMTDKPLTIGIEPGYERERDVRIQTALVRPDVPVVASLEELAARMTLPLHQQSKENG